MALDSMREICEKAEQGQKPFWRVVLETDIEEREVTEEASMEKMRFTWKAILESVENYREDRRSVSGLVGGDGQKMRDYAKNGTPLCGEYLREVIATALCVGESNACMCKIVAAPTAGACGVLPGCWCRFIRAGTPERKRFYRRCTRRPASERSSRTGPVSPAPPADARRRSARRPLWRPVP